MKGLICELWRHKWNHTLNEAEHSWFFRVDCLRCGLAIDAAPLVKLRIERPALWAYVAWQMPKWIEE